MLCNNGFSVRHQRSSKLTSEYYFFFFLCPSQNNQEWNLALRGRATYPAINIVTHYCAVETSKTKGWREGLAFFLKISFAFEPLFSLSWRVFYKARYHSGASSFCGIRVFDKFCQFPFPQTSQIGPCSFKIKNVVVICTITAAVGTENDIIWWNSLTLWFVWIWGNAGRNPYFHS